ncbi:DUF885 domain-containing protein [Nitrospirillum iridis]|uniref:Uncharacterized protein (DUF885 family) n=1 Tax=Nitrospirillum iridis TaxID=765888 RepID=A0A7X0AWX8_9PROT|nr:DUF885 family protein [Nitrospirillum iridis]MBB6251629.1 uncharacterized protein (DUF885 family) [Nitrospirillum iridis]
MFNRRAFLAASAASVALAAAGPGLAADASAQTPAGGKAAADLNHLLDVFFQEDLRRSPEGATMAGMDTGTLAGLRGKLDDRSDAGRKANDAATADQLRRLRGIDRKALTGIDAVNYDSVDYVLTDAMETATRFPFGSGGSPYVLCQLAGAYQSIPNFLDVHHPVEGKADADAYLARLEAFASALDTETAQFKRDAAEGILAADFMLDTTLTQLRALRVDVAQSGLVSSLAKRAAAKGLGDAYGAEAAKVYTDKVGPALDRQIAAVAAGRAKATHDAGVWHIKDGAAWYAQGLKSSTTTTLSPDEVHQIGLDQAREIGARLDTLLKAQGLSQGTVAERIKALRARPESTYPNTDAGKAQLVADLQVKLDDMVSRLPRMFRDLPKAKARVQRVPTAIEAGAPLAYYESPPLEGDRVGTIYFNLHDTAEWPKWSLPSTLYHEGIPGHHLQGCLAQETPGIPLYRANMFFSGYGEGWALYAEQLADELGMYDADPLGRIGYLKFLLFRAGRCVIDTGMHHKRWTREQAVDYMVNLTGDAPTAMTREVDRYCAWPGQACSYKIGHTMWNRLRDEAKAALGAKFDIKDFHQVGLNSGAVPLDVLQTMMGDYIARVKRG